MAVPSFSQLNQKHPHVLNFGLLTAFACMLAIYSWVAFQIATLFTSTPDVRYVLTVLIVIAMLAATFTIAFYRADPKNHRRK